MESKTYSQKVDEWLFAKSGCHIIDFCRKFGYYPLAIKIMALDENDEKKSKAIMSKDAELKNHYIKCSKDPQSIARKGNNRSWTRYFKDLITGWVVEDLVMEMLKEQGIEIEHNGHDAKRRIAIGNDVTQDADFVIKVGKVSRQVELTNEFNQLLAKNGFIEKRVPALLNVWKEKGIWIYRDLMNGKYVLVDFATEHVKLHLRRHNNVQADWSKDVHRYVLAENGKKVRDDKLLSAEIISVVGCSIDGREQPKIEEIEDKDSPPQNYGVGGNRRNVKSNVEAGIAYPGIKETRREDIKFIQKERYAEGIPLEKFDKAIQKSRVTSEEAAKVKKPENLKTKFSQSPAPQPPPPQEQEEEELPADYDYGDGDFV